MKLSRVVEYAFFFGLLGLAGYMVWLITAPFVSALALALIIVTICYPLYERIRLVVPRNNKTVAALLATLFVLIVVILPLVLISTVIVREMVNFYQVLNAGQELSVDAYLENIEAVVGVYVPGFEVSLTEILKQGASWFTGNIGAIFAGTVSTIFVFFIAIIGSFYFFRDGKELLQIVISASPLPNNEDHIIFERMAKAVRAVATGTLLVALIQGTLATTGFAIFGIDRAILWGSLASLGALIPGAGTTIVTAPAIAYLFFTGNTVGAVGLTIWSVLIVGLVDNLLGPYLIGRGNKMHPFIILIAVLGGISLFGPIGFVVGPVVVTLFLVLLEIYNQYIVNDITKKSSRSQSQS